MVTNLLLNIDSKGVSHENSNERFSAKRHEFHLITGKHAWSALSSAWKFGIHQHEKGSGPGYPYIRITRESWKARRTCGNEGIRCLYFLPGCMNSLCDGINFWNEHTVTIVKLVQPNIRVETFTRFWSRLLVPTGRIQSTGPWIRYYKQKENSATCKHSVVVSCIVHMLSPSNQP